jgi:hypothetical protein
MHNPKYLAEVIITKNRQYEDISQVAASMRIACKTKEDNILNELEKKCMES